MVCKRKYTKENKRMDDMQIEEHTAVYPQKDAEQRICRAFVQCYVKQVISLTVYQHSQ